MVRRGRVHGLLGSLAVIGVLAGCAIDDPSTSPSAVSSASTQTPPRPSPSSSPSPTSTTVPTPAPTVVAPEPRSAQFEQILRESHDKGWFPTAIVGVWSPQGTWVGTIGETGGRPVAREDHVRIGSVTKTFTVTLLLQLAEEGKLSLEDPISRYVEGVPNGEATLRQLADMTSGIANFTALDSFDDAVEADHQRAWTTAEVVDLIRGQEPLWPPGQRYYYSNSNTVLLGVVIEKVAKQPFDAVLRQRILGPLGLTGTSFPLDGTMPEPALPGTTDEGEVGGPVLDATSFNPSYLFSAGQMVSTVDDMHTWAVALASGKGLLEESTQEQRLLSLAPVVAPNTERRSYGLGLIRWRGWIGHTGEVPGYTCVVLHKPETETTLVTLVGTSVYAEGVQRPAESLFDVFERALG